MTTWLLEGYNTDRRYDDVRYRAYTTSKRKVEAFNQIPKIQFTDSGHGIVFAATELRKGARRLEPRYVLDEYVREHLAAQRPTVRKFLHLRYNPNADIPGKWSVWTSKGAIRCNIDTFEEADRWAHDFCRDTGSVYGSST